MVENLIEGFKFGSIRIEDEGCNINIKYEGFKLTPTLVIKAAVRFYEANKDINISSITVDASNAIIKESVLGVMQDLNSKWEKCTPKISVITPYIEKIEEVIPERIVKKEVPVQSKKKHVRSRTKIIR